MQDQLRRLEGAGVLVSRTVGRARVFEFNPRNPTLRRLRTFLAEELDDLPESLVKKYSRAHERRHPDARHSQIRRARSP